MRVALLAPMLVLALATTGADARVVHIPTIGELCPGNDDWAKVAQCIGRQGSFKIVRDEPNAKLVHITAQSRLAGLALYTRATRDKRWRFTGDMRMDHDHELLDVRRMSYGPRTGYRIDVGISYPMTFSVDTESFVQGVSRHRIAMLCIDGNIGCVQVMTSCDALVQGKALYTFRGKLVYEGRQLEVVGDRRNAGPYCAQDQLVWAD
jgi:hypothetical protein